MTLPQHRSQALHTGLALAVLQHRCCAVPTTRCVSCAQARRTSLELAAVRTELEHLQDNVTARDRALSTFMKRRAKALAAAVQERLAQGVLHAWQRQGLRQQQATWMWGDLAHQLLLQPVLVQHATHTSCKVSCGHGLHTLQQREEHSALHGNEPNADASCDGAGAAWHSIWHAGMQPECLDSSSSSGQAGSLMQRRLQRRQQPEDSCASAPGTLLSAAWDAWVLSTVAGRARRTSQVNLQPWRVEL